MKIHEIFVRIAIGATAGAFLGNSAFASPSDAQPLSYDDVIKIIGQGRGNVKKTKALLTGLNISIKVQAGAHTVFLNDKDQVFFTCKNLKSFKAGETVSAKVVDYSETSGDNDPLIWLESCNSTQAQTNGLLSTKTASGEEVYRTSESSVPGYKEKFIKLESVEISGKIVRDKNGGGWFYALVVPGKKPIRIDIETEANYKAFEKISDTDALFLVKGDVGTFPGGDKAFDTTKLLTIRRNS